VEIKFWYDESEKKLFVIHIGSQTRKVITNEEKIRNFLDAYQLTLEDCKRVREDEDRLGLFAKKRIFGMSL
jgi:hypothetical protein